MLRKDPNIRAMLDYVHKYKLKHAGPKHMLTLRQEGMWIIHGAQECRLIVTKCHDCIRAFKKPMEQKMDILPKIRLTPSPHFNLWGWI